MSLNDLTIRIKEECPEILRFVSKLKDGASFSSEDENQLVRGCADRLLPEHLLGTLVHELGHNFGMRHNFRGSTDKANFYDVSETGTKTQVPSSSVMEYPATEDSRLMKPGKYDIAAIRFAYGGKAELESGEVLTLDPSQDLATQVGARPGAKLKSYQFCTDEDVDVVGADPLCQRHDSGTTPEEIVDHHIRIYQATYALTNFRYDRRSLGDNTGFKLTYTMLPLKRIYDEWRFLLGRYVGLGKEYLENYSEQDYQKLLKAMESDPQYSAEYKLWRPAALKAFNFLLNTAFLPNRYCVTENAAKKRDILELEVLRQEIFRTTGASVAQCTDPEVTAYFNRLGKKVIDETGYSLNSYRISKREEDLTEPLDVLGISADRANAMSTLTARIPLSRKHLLQGYLPAFIDEPNFRETLFAYLQDRLFQGVDLDKHGIRFAPRFRIESDLIEQFLNLYLKGIRVPGKPDATSKRMLQFKGVSVPTPKLVEDAKHIAKVGSTYYAAMDDSPTFFIGVMKAREKIEGMSAEPLKPEKFRGIINVFNKLPADCKEAEKLTLEQFATLYGELGSANQELGDTLDDILSDEQKTLINSAMAPIEAAKKSAQEQKLKSDEFKNFIKTKMVGEFLGGKPFPLCRENFKDFEARLQATISEQKDRQKSYLDNKLDWDAQNELMLKLLDSLSGGR